MREMMALDAAPTATMGFASDDKRLRRTSVRTIAGRYRKAGGFATRYWTPELQAGAFALPRFIVELVDADSAPR